MGTLYVVEQGARIEKEHQRFLVTKEDQVLAEVPAARLGGVVLVGNVGVTTPALVALLEQQIPLTMLDSLGQLRGRLVPAMAKNIGLRHLQYERARDAQFCLRISRAIVIGKLRSYRYLAGRILRARTASDQREQMVRLAHCLKQAGRADSMDSLRGCEGAGSRAYFAVLRTGLRAGMGFEKRARRPPPDPINALMGLGYTLLGHSLMAALETVGLDPYDGFYHADKYGRPALALDLVEEFRAPIVDSIVRTMVNKRVVGPEDFSPGPGGGLRCSQRGLRMFFHQYSARLATAVKHPSAGRALTYQKCFEVQARILARVLKGEMAEYVPFITR